MTITYWDCATHAKSRRKHHVVELNLVSRVLTCGHRHVVGLRNILVGPGQAEFFFSEDKSCLRAAWSYSERKSTIGCAGGGGALSSQR